MLKMKRGLAALVAVLLLFSMAPIAMAESPDVPEDVILVGPVEVVDEVTYNTGEMDVVVGWDQELAESGEPYCLFNDDGSYTIEIPEPDPFFPYEVQFTYNGETTTEWFMDAEDTVVIGGHVFSVLVYGEPQSIGFWVGEEYVPAYPEEKTFTNAPGAEPASLLPLKTDSVTVNLEGYLLDELKNVKISTLLAEKNIGGQPAVVWAELGEDDYTIADMDTAIDLSSLDAVKYVSGGNYSYRIRLQLIVGTADQLDMDNIKYTVWVYVTSEIEQLEFSAYTEEGDEIRIAQPEHWYSRNYGVNDVLLIYANSDTWTGGEAKLAMTLGSKINAEGLAVTVYEGYYETEEAALEAGAQDITGTVWGEAAKGFLADYSDIKQLPGFTVVAKRDGETVSVIRFHIRMQQSYESFSLSSLKKYDEETGSYTYIYPRYKWDSSGEYYELEAGYSADDEYYAVLYYSDSLPPEGADGKTGSDLIQKAVVGDFDTLEDAQDKEDIKDVLFSYSYGYPAVYNEGVTFTAFDLWGKAHKYTLRVVEGTFEVSAAEPDPLSADTYFRAQSAVKVQSGEESGSKNISINSYVMNYGDDSYYYNGYQTVFIINSNSTPVTDEKIIPKFYTGDKVVVYAGHDSASGTKQVSGETPVTFESGKAIQYSAAAENGTHLKNYWVTFVTQQTGGAKLFVNAGTNSEHKDEESGLPVREVFLDDAHGNHHDVFFANIGDEELTGLYVRLEDAQNIQLDPYWTIGETTTLAAFDSINGYFSSSYSYVNDEQEFIAKIRLLPETDADGNAIAGEIKGTLVIGSENGEEVKIKLTGIAGTPKITTESIVDGVRYVPYSSVIQTNNMYAADSIVFEVASGSLPDGVILKQNGEIYGVPTVAGTFEFSVKATYDGKEMNEVEYTLTIADNTNENVWYATDDNYDIQIAIVSYDGTVKVYLDGEEFVDEELGGENSWDEDSQVFKSAGTFSYFIDLWLDGDKLEKGVDYNAEEGSTKITILNQTLKSKGDGTHTIAMEFREGDPNDGPLKRTAQNYEVKNTGSGSGSGSGSGGGSGSGSGYGKKPSQSSSQNDSSKEQGSTGENVSTSGFPFVDVRQADWFYGDVKWAYEAGYMVGVSETIFAPDYDISQATVVTVLARLANVDLDEFDGVKFDSVPEGKWYTNAAVWAKQAGLLPDHTDFKGEEVITREEMAIMLVKFLKRMGIDCTDPDTAAYFADADKMSEAGYDAFQTLYKTGIFKGMGNNVMDPLGTTTRAQFSALINRVNSCIN